MPARTPQLRQSEDPFHQIHTVFMKQGQISEYSAPEISWTAFSRVPFEKKEGQDKEKRRTPNKIHPRLRQWIRQREADAQEHLLVTFDEDLLLPRFPEPFTEQPRKSAGNQRALRRAQELIREITGRRASGYERLIAELAEKHNAKVLETFWLIKALLIEMPLGRIEALAERQDVVYIQPRYAGERPPMANNEVDEGRALMVSDPYFNLGQTGGWIGLLDTGVRFSHTQFNSPSQIAFHRDCVNGGSDCNTGSGLNPNDDCWNHGTSTAAIITGNNNQGDDFRGVTGITLDSFKVYPSTFSSRGACTGGLDSAAAVRGFQAAVGVLDRVIVAEMQGGGNDLDAISLAADAAFDTGAVVIAANGNNGPGASTVNAPAIAHRALGVGNFDVQTQNPIASQSRGPAPDGRIKPDIQTPTNTNTASNASDTAHQVFTGTSGATPYAAGAAALLRNWLRGASFSIDPGQVYAQMILSGHTTYPFDNTSGAGHLRLPTDGWAWWGKVSISNGMTIDIPVTVSGFSPNTFDAALWWPEFVFSVLGIRIDIHNDVDLYLLDPSGSVRAASVSIPSVFERARVSGSIASGTWTVRIRGYNVNGSQTVYWAAAAHVM